MSLTRSVRQALGSVMADLVIKNGGSLNLVTGATYTADSARNRESGTIVGVGEGYVGESTIDGKHLTSVPGFIDTHVHVESSKITPLEFDRAVLPSGTTTAICDPHEMSNVLGMDALRYFIACSEVTKMDLLVNLSSCVPATPLETSGARLTAKDLVSLRDHRNVVGLAEFMDIGGVMSQNPDTMEKLEAFQDGHIDGHMPTGVSGRMLNALAACGIANCHETARVDHAEEKLRLGIQVFIREGSVCKNATELAPLVTPMRSPFLGLCTDDRSCSDITSEGHLDHVVRTVIAHGGDVASTYRAATWSGAQNFGLHKNTPKWRRRGLVAPGWKADLVLLEGALKHCKVHSVIKNAQLVTPELFATRGRDVPVIGHNSIKIKTITEADFALKRPQATTIPVIELIKHSVETSSTEYCLPVDAEGRLQRDLGRDIAKLAVLERHGKNGNIGVWFVKGFGLRPDVGGAIASSVGHDSHNITVVGASDAEMTVAVNRLRDIQGGFVVVKGGRVIGELALPVAGIMSDQSLHDVRQGELQLMAAVRQLGLSVDEPFMHLMFLPLCVIPKLKLTDFGPVRFDPQNGDMAPVLIDDQRKSK